MSERPNLVPIDDTAEPMRNPSTAATEHANWRRRFDARPGQELTRPRPAPGPR